MTTQVLICVAIPLKWTEIDWWSPLILHTEHCFKREIHWPGLIVGYCASIHIWYTVIVVAKAGVRVQSFDLSTKTFAGLLHQNSLFEEEPACV